MSKPTQHKKITVGGAPEGFDASLLAGLVRTRAAPVLHVARDDKRLAATLKARGVFSRPSMPVFTFPGWDCLPYDRVSPNADCVSGAHGDIGGAGAGMPNRFCC